MKKFFSLVSTIGIVAAGITFTGCNNDGEEEWSERISILSFDLSGAKYLVIDDPAADTRSATGSSYDNARLLKILSDGNSTPVIYNTDGNLMWSGFRHLSKKFIKITCCLLRTPLSDGSLHLIISSG
ncbi:MAG: hypothetical protein LIO85_00685 [Rikenellaceae bacterium]|nr:hypothetical protein [Rikenellaceae bacterium]MCC8174242.1 hypothetical protein [Odoribacter sp.]